MDKTEKAKKIKKTIRNLIVFILLIGLTFYLIFKDQNVLEILNIAVSVKKRYILVAIIAMCLYLLGETINITRILKELGEKSTFLRNIRYTLIGFFFSSITPAASGGQPMEIYYMHKEKIAVANSTLALLVHLTSFQIVTITLGIVSTVIHFEIVKSGLIYLVIVGILLNSTALTLLAISIFSKRLSKGLINFAVKVLKFFRVKNIDAKKENSSAEIYLRKPEDEQYLLWSAGKVKTETALNFIGYPNIEVFLEELNKEESQTENKSVEDEEDEELE